MASARQPGVRERAYGPYLPPVMAHSRYGTHPARHVLLPLCAHTKACEARHVW